MSKIGPKERAIMEQVARESAEADRIVQAREAKAGRDTWQIETGITDEDLAEVGGCQEEAQRLGLAGFFRRRRR